MADEIEPTTEETPEVEAHSAEEVLDLQQISIDEEARTGFNGTAPVQGSCSSCVGSLCM